MKPINLHEPHFDADDEIYVLETLRSSWVSTGGPFVDRFEKEFAEFTQAKYAISVCNGTIALSLALDVLKRQRQIPQSFDVIIPTLTFVATANAVFHAGGMPNLVDSSKDIFNINPEAVKEKVLQEYVFDTSSATWFHKVNTRPLLAVMPAHIMGYTCNMTLLEQICEKLKIPLIEDAAEALGSYETDGRHVGTRGLAACFSFNGNKILTTGGGGMLITNDEVFAKRAKHLSTTAKTDNLRFEHDEVGYNYRLVNILAALGCSQLPKLKARLVRKKEIFELYQSQLNTLDLELVTESNNQPNYWLVNARFQTNDTREKALSMLNRQGIMSRPLWTPVHKLPFAKTLVPAMTTFPNAEAMWNTVLSLPSSPQLEDQTIIKICSIIKEALG